MSYEYGSFTFKNAVALYMVAAISDSTAALLAFLYHQLMVAAERKGWILQGICNRMVSFLSFHWLKSLFLLLQPGYK